MMDDLIIDGLFDLARCISNQERAEAIARLAKRPVRDVFTEADTPPYRAKDHKPKERIRFKVERKSRRTDARDGQGLARRIDR